MALVWRVWGDTKGSIFIRSLVTFVWSSGDAEKAMAPHSSTLAWKIPWLEEPGRLQSKGSLRLDTTEQLHFHFSLSCIGAGNGNPLQYSCLENPMGRGAWWAAVHGVAESWTRISDFTFTFHFHALEQEMATHSSVLAWRIPGTVEPGGLPSMGSHRVGHDWSDLAAASSSSNTIDTGDTGSVPGSGRYPGEENGNPLQYSCLENPMDRGAWWATVHGVAKELEMPEHIHACPMGQISTLRQSLEDTIWLECWRWKRILE